MVNSVKVEAYYNRAKDVPTIGQRKTMRVNGKGQKLVLNHIEAKRLRTEDMDTFKIVTEFSTIEIWGQYYI